MSTRSILIFLGLTAFAATAVAQSQNVTEIWKCADASGRPLYTSDRKDTAGKKCELVSREINVVAPQKPASPPRSTGSLRESSEQRAAAKERQRGILEGELKTEEGLLAKAQQELAAQQDVRYGNERNYARVLERLQPYQDNVDLHQKNVDALKRELSNLDR